MLVLLSKILLSSDKNYLLKERKNGHTNQNVRTKFFHSNYYHSTITLNSLLREDKGGKNETNLTVTKKLKELACLGL